MSAISCIVSGLRCGDPAAGDDLVERDPVLLEVVDDPAVAERDRLEQRAVDLLGRALQRQPEDRAGEVGVGEDRAVAVEPVERDQPGLAGPERGRARARAARRSRPTVQRAHEPRQHVADGRLPRLVAVQPGQDPVPSDAGDPGQADLVGIEHHVADRGPDHGHERPRALDPGARDRHERVDVADRDRDLLGAAQQSRPARRSAFRRGCRAARTSVPSFSPGRAKPG